MYDAENRLASTAGITYTYGGNGERVLKSNTSTGAALKRYWSMGGNTLAEDDGSGNITAEYIYFGGKRVARIDLPANTVHYYLSDHLGSTSIVASAVGAIEQESDYYPFGTEVVVTAGPNNYKFTGKERDSETQLDYFGARYYSNGLGRFVTPDWAEKATAVPYAEFDDPQTLNLYAYVGNAPIHRVDKDGHWWPIVVAVVAAAVIIYTIENYHASLNKEVAAAGQAHQSYTKAVDAAARGDAAAAQKHLDQFQQKDMKKAGSAASGAAISGAQVSGTLTGGLPGTGNLGTVGQSAANTGITNSGDSSTNTSAGFGDTMLQTWTDIKGLFSSGPTPNPFEPKSPSQDQNQQGVQQQQNQQNQQNDPNGKDDSRDLKAPQR